MKETAVLALVSSMTAGVSVSRVSCQDYYSLFLKKLTMPSMEATKPID
jgi:hypothetical protein